jgi:hypothetical protein
MCLPEYSFSHASSFCTWIFGCPLPVVWCIAWDYVVGSRGWVSELAPVHGYAHFLSGNGGQGSFFTPCLLPFHLNELHEHLMFRDLR